MRISMLWKKNNKGSSMVMVIVAVALVSILVSTLLSTTLLNYRMKGQERVEKMNFYSAEGALEEIKAGIQVQVSAAFESAYDDVMDNFAVYDTREENFKTLYINTLFDYYERDDISGRYNAIDTNDTDGKDGLSSYFDKTKPVYDTDGTTVLKGAEIIMNDEHSNDQHLTIEPDGLLFQNLVVQYKDGKGNVSQIKTDLLIGYPNLNLEETEAMPPLEDYAIVANSVMEIDEMQSVILEGNVYAGDNQMLLSQGSTLDISKVNTLIANDVEIARGVTLKDTSPATSTSFWANNIKITRANEVTLSGNTYVANDLNVNGKGSNDNTGTESNIILKGIYQGFGTAEAAKLSSSYRFLVSSGLMPATYIDSHKADFSSAMVINGKDINLNLLGLTGLSLADNAYISALSLVGSESGEAGASSMVDYIPDVDVQMGESVTVKSNQLAYMVPPSLIGVGKQHGGINPMTASTFESLMAEYGLTTDAEVPGDILDRKAIIPGIGKALEQLEGEGIAVSGVQTVFYPIGGSTVVYMFLDFADTESANNYFKQYYDGNEDELSGYLSIYNNTIQFDGGENVTLNLSGNMLKGNTDDGYSFIEDTDFSATATSQATQQDIYAALKLKMLNDYGKIKPEDKIITAGGVSRYATVYDNLVEAKKISTLAANKTFVAADGTEAHVINKGTPYTVAPDGTYTYDYDSNTYTIKIDADTKGVYVVNGNVVIENAAGVGNGIFTGLIIASGKITVQQGCTIVSSQEIFNKVLSAMNGTEYFYEYLKNGANYLQSGGAGSSTSSGTIHLGDLIITRNWEKR